MKRLFDTFAKAGKDLYLVGGAVRDLALGMPLELLDDLDFCTNARPAETLKILKDAGFSTYEMGFEFGTVGCVLPGPADEGFPKDCQITTYRSQEYYRRGSRHPIVKFGDTIDQDLKRRDFSINSIAMDANGEFVDPYDGLGDLEKGVLRVVGDPQETLAEDPLRILRIGRFQSRFGFEVEEQLREAAFGRAECILEISRERWLQEMNKLLKGVYVERALQFLYDVRILGIILPEVSAMVGFSKGGEDLWRDTLGLLKACPQNETLRWAALLHNIGKVSTCRESDGLVTFERHEAAAAMLAEGVAQRFKFDHQMADAVRFVVANQGRVKTFASEWTDAAVRRFVREMDPYVDVLLDFCQADLTTGKQNNYLEALEQIEKLRGRLRALEAARQLRPSLPAGIGKDIMKTFDLRPGPIVGHYKSLLEDKIIEGELRNGESTAYYLDYLTTNLPSFDGLA